MYYIPVAICKISYYLIPPLKTYPFCARISLSSLTILWSHYCGHNIQGSPPPNYSAASVVVVANTLFHYLSGVLLIIPYWKSRLLCWLEFENILQSSSMTAVHALVLFDSNLNLVALELTSISSSRCRFLKLSRWRSSSSRRSLLSFIICLLRSRVLAIRNSDPGQQHTDRLMWGHCEPVKMEHFLKIKVKLTIQRRSMPAIIPSLIRFRIRSTIRSLISLNNAVISV